MIYKIGSKGTHIRILQYFLGIEADGIFGKQTESELKKFQIDYGKKPTGAVDEEFMDFVLKKVYQWQMKHIQLANKLVGIKEIDIDNDGKTDNRGKEIDEMIKFVYPWFDLSQKNKKGLPWCAIFVTYLLHKSYPEQSEMLIKSAKAKEILEYAKTRIDSVRLTNISQIRPDTIIIGGWVNDNGLGHVYVVDPVRTLLRGNPKLVITIEGNTNIGNSREGDGVYIRTRSLVKNEVYQFLNLKPKV